MPMVSSRPPSPYLSDAAHGVFVGQRELLQSVEAVLRSPDRSAVLLYGPRRCGKTALLLQLQHALPSPPLLPIYMELRERAHDPLGRLLHEIAAALAREVQMSPEDAERLGDAERFDDEGRHFQREVLPALYAALPAGYRPLLLLDDIDALDAVADRLPDGACGRALWPLLQRLLAEEPRLCFVLTSGRRLAELSTEARASLAGAAERAVPLLDEEGARALLAAGEAAGALSAGPGAAARALALTGGHPHLLRVLYQQALELAAPAAPLAGGDGAEDGDGVAEGQAAAPPVIDGDRIDAAAERAQAEAAAFLEERFQELSLPEQIVAAALAQAVPAGGAASAEELAGILQRAGVRMMTRELELAPDALCERDVLQRRAAGPLGFRVELLRRHVAQRHPLSGLRADLQQLVPAAGALYEQAVRLHEEGALGEAEDALGRALRKNPNHGAARVLLGQVLAEEGRLEEACRELEEASRTGDEAARLALLRTLLSLGEQQERSAEEERALQTYERALELAPKDAVAQERRGALLSARAERAHALGDYAGARALYEQAGRWDRVAAMEERTKNTELRRLGQGAEQAEAEGDWDRAAELYRRLAEGDPERFGAAAARAREEAAVRRGYVEAEEAMAGGDFEQAMRSLGEVVRLRPRYKDAQALLSRAAERHAQARRLEGAGPLRRLLSRTPAWALLLVLVGTAGAAGLGVWTQGRAQREAAMRTRVIKLPDEQGATRPGPPLPRPRVEPTWGQAAGREAATAALRLAEQGNARDALGKLREAHRIDPHPAWLYDLGILHDRLGECDDAGFFYRAALFGKGVPPEDRALVEARLDFLDGECRFKQRQAGAADRHARAARFLGLKLCALAESLLSGIATAAEVAELERCLGRAVTAGVAAPKHAPGRAGSKAPPGAKAAAGAEAPAGGRAALLTVTTTPTATVYVDGARLGATPLQEQPVKPGSRTVLLVCDELGKKQKYKINANAGTTYTINYRWSP